MDINYVSYLDPYVYGGGGEMVIRDLLEVGLRRGHHIKRSYVYPHQTIDLFGRPDLWLGVDLYNYRRRVRPQPELPEWLIREITSACVPYVHFDNAYVDVCDTGYLPCNGLRTPGHCPGKSMWQRLILGSRCLRERTSTIYQSASLNVFVSPLHRRTVQDVLGPDVVGAYYEVLPYVDTHKFRERRETRDIEFLFVGVMTEAKGLEEMRKLFGGRREIMLIGAKPSRVDVSFGRWLGKVSYQEIPALLNRAANFVFLPRWPEPCGRVVMEAALCGCNLMINDRVGAASFGLDLSDPRTYDGTRERFWARIEQLGES